MFNSPKFNQITVNIAGSDIYIAVKRLKHGKSCGTDGICSEYLKLGSALPYEYLFLLFLMYLNLGTTPNVVCSGKTANVPKTSRVKSKCSLHRQITVSSGISKVFNHVLAPDLIRKCLVGDK